MPGFQANGEDLKIEAGVKRLSPAAQRGDLQAFADGVRSLQERYGHAIAKAAMGRVMVDHPQIYEGVIGLIGESSPETKEEFEARAVEIMAETLEDAGLQLESHLRVTDRGIALSKAGIAVLAAVSPNVFLGSEGNDALEGIGLSRIGGFVHPLAEAIEPTQENSLPEGVLNLWAVASLVISGAMGWAEGDRHKCYQAVAECVARSAPTANLDILLRRSRYDDRFLLRLCALVCSGLETKAANELGI
jgi:hypothetical protein